MGDVRRFHQIGGHVAIDFVNTLGGLPEDPDDEYLHGYDDLVYWTGRVKLLSPKAAANLIAAAGTDVASARRTLVECRRLRDSLDRRLRDRIRPGPSTCPDDGAAVQAAYVSAIAHASPDFTSGNLQWRWPEEAGTLELPLWPIAVAAIDLLRAGPLHLLGRCEHCRWLFLDTSRQHNRRWCSMSACGAIVKMRRYRAARQR
jgi:predicted RNA-binding Zn ribbon-like protein